MKTKMKNKFDLDIEKRISNKIDREILDFLNEILNSSKIKDLAPRISSLRPHPIFYASSKEGFEKIIKEGINIQEFSGKVDFKVYFEKIHIYKEVYRYTPPDIFIERVTKNHDDGFCSYEYNKIASFSDKSEIKKFVIALAPQYMVDGGFVYDEDTNKLLPHIGKEIKKINRKNLEECLQEYLITPTLERK